MSLNMYIFFNEWYNTIYTSVYNLYTYLEKYYYGLNNIWFFITGYDMPVPISNINNINDVQYSWKYDNNCNILSYTAINTIPSEFNEYELAWLSAKIRVGSDDESSEYDIDIFVENFVIKTSHYLPSLKTIFICWCIYSRLWFSIEENIEFIIIDEMANENIININDDTRHLRFKRVGAGHLNHNDGDNNSEDNEGDNEGDKDETQ
jgi:hypothetical protein